MWGQKIGDKSAQNPFYAKKESSRREPQSGETPQKQRRDLTFKPVQVSDPGGKLKTKKRVLLDRGDGPQMRKLNKNNGGGGKDIITLLFD